MSADTSNSILEKFVEWVTCDICASDKFQIIYPSTFNDQNFSSDRFKSFTYANSDRSRGNIVRCQNCGLIYMNPRDRDVAALYQDVDDPYYFSSSADRLVSFKHDLKQLEAVTKISKGKLLDVGCSYGFFLDAAVEAGWQVWGSELSEKQSSYAKKNHPTVHHATVAESGFAPNFFDVITAFDVLEHVPSPRAFLQELKTVLKPGGYLVMTTPDISSWPARLTRKFWMNFVRMHLYYFSPKTVTKLLESEGYRIVEIKRHRRVVTLGIAVEWMKKHQLIYRPLRLLLGNRLVKNWRVQTSLSGNMTVYARKNS